MAQWPFIFTFFPIFFFDVTRKFWPFFDQKDGKVPFFYFFLPNEEQFLPNEQVINIRMFEYWRKVGHLFAHGEYGVYIWTLD